MNILESIRQEVESKMGNDPAHDLGHVMRVYKNAQRICRDENANKTLVLSAVLLHDIVSFPKSDRRSKLSATKSAQKSQKILAKYNFTSAEIQIICDAIRDHSFSSNRTPRTMEGKILQDADRLDAIGSIGIARVFTVGGSEDRLMYKLDDPFCKNRTPDDKTWTLDHFYKKLLKIESSMNTKSARMEAKRRAKILGVFLEQLESEI